ncbi:MAG TPA: exopolysaccharide biosynthesis polyprenyl glycosylphosphotransferase [Actinomycetota bacterium]|nr:exopolysaccharide biosynthesis polyprenyl glycosylphosphotransferase [Actinomycetota bacterium]
MGTATVSVMPLRQRFHLTARRQTFSLAAVDVITMATAVFLWHPPAFALDILGLALLVIIRWRLGLYRARFHLSALDEFPRAIEAGFLAAGIYALFGLISQFNVTLSDIAWLTATGVALALLRVPLYVILRDLRRNDLARERMLLVGGGLVADAIADMAEDNPDYGLDLAGRVPDLLDVDLAQAAIDTNSSTVLVAFSRASEAREVFEIRRGLAVGLTIMAVPRYFDLIGEDRADDEVFGVPVLRLGAGHPTIGLAVKRGMDILLAATALVLLSPLLAVAGFLVKRETGGDLLFRQTRIGMGGKAFELLKLQTMKPVSASTSDTTWSVTPDSDRLGRVGSFLRKTSIDELPQLWNILRGDMSFVGPRPERPFFVEQFSEQYAHYEDRLRMPAGLTGLAQIHDLRGDTSIDDRARFDNRYEDHWSLWSDVKIILKTVPKVFKGSGG